MMSEIRLNPVGRIDVVNDRFYLSIKSRYREAMKELEGFSHIIVVWWGNHSESQASRQAMVAHRPYKNGPDTVGIFATRSEVRPNPILITTAAILSIDLDQGRIELPWIDAENGSPVVDLKPYQPCSDRVKTVQLPEWCAQWPQWYEDSATFNWASVFNF